MMKPRTTIIVFASFLAILATYKIWNRGMFIWAPRQGNGLHRSNAMRRRQRSGTNHRHNNENEQDSLLEDSDQNDETIFVLDHNLIDNDNASVNSITQDENSWNLHQNYDRNGQNVVQLLFRVSEDATKRNSYVHRGCACNCCGMVPIRGTRYRCANCTDYDLCESCESQGVHIKTHVFYKIRIPASALGPRNTQPVWYLGDPDSVPRQLPKETILKLSRETGFERPELDAQWEQWTFMANTDWRDDPHEIFLAMDRKTFERCLIPSGGSRHVSPCLIFDRMFAFYDTNKDDLIGFSEFLHGIAFRKKKDKWKKIFEGYDIDEDGYVDRKDFLRMFRSYYVLYRTMHADMLEGMIEQQMSSADAHRLVGCRQPLSSAFGQDGRFPRAPDLKTGEGKAQVNGDLEIIDGKGVINESAHDHGNRHEVFKHELLKRNCVGDRASRGYWEVMLNPPSAAEQVPNMLQNIRLTNSQSTDELIADPHSLNDHLDLLADEGRQMQAFDDDGDDTHSGSDDDSWPPNFIQVTDEDAEAIEGPGTRVADVRNSSRRDVISHAILRIRSQRDATLRLQTQRDVYDRWQRRHFYTEEEEGGKPPADWKDDYDVLVRNGIAGESSKSSRPTFNSRSSSKVHFAEDMNDFDTRSNPSTSSRSIPERWGGLEIPDAERDAGKEILYQVTQQAFNELLDPLFKEKEDIAIEAAALKLEREKYHYLYTIPEFEEWAKFQTNSPGNLEDNSSTNPDGQVFYVALSNANRVTKVPVRESNETTHLASEGSSTEANRNISSQDPPKIALDATDCKNSWQDNASCHSETESTLNVTNSHKQTSLHSELLSILSKNDEESPKISESVPLNSTIQAENSQSPTYRDPTMPQYRPNRLPSTSVASHDHLSVPSSYDDKALSDDEMNWHEKEAHLSRPANPTPESQEQTHIGQAGKKESKKTQLENFYVGGISISKLLKLWQCEKAAEEAEQRGGWGKLNFREFEDAVKGAIETEKSARDLRDLENPPRMDYLGSWIEFCIP